MPTQVSGDPTAVSLLSWTRSGGSSDVNAVTTDDGDTSYVRRSAQPGGGETDWVRLRNELKILWDEFNAADYEDGKRNYGGR